MLPPWNAWRSGRRRKVCVVDSADYRRGFGGAALAARLRRASERLDRDGTRVYAARNVRFEQRWYGLLRQLIANGPMTIGDIASVLRITHASVSESARSLAKAGIVLIESSSEDGRRRYLSLTVEGCRLANDLTPLWEAFNAAAAQLDEEAGELTRALDRLDESLDRRSMFDRIMVLVDRADTNVD